MDAVGMMCVGKAFWDYSYRNTWYRLHYKLERNPYASVISLLLLPPRVVRLI